MLISILLGSGDIVTKLTYLAIYLIAIIFSLSIHEWGHAYAAHKNGDDTARMMGRMTLNPIAHIDPTGFILLLIAGFGWAKPVPVNPRNYRNYRRGEFIVSFAGIFMNLMLALTAALLAAVFAACDLKSMGYEVTPDLVTLVSYLGFDTTFPSQLYDFFWILGTMNCCLAIFNLLPVYPLDGSHIFELFFGKLVGAKVLMWLHRNGRYVLYGVFILSAVLANTAGISIIGSVAEWIYSKFSLLFAWLASLVF